MPFIIKKLKLKKLLYVGLLHKIPLKIHIINVVYYSCLPIENISFEIVWVFLRVCSEVLYMYFYIFAQGWRGSTF